jgi:hypothetical protein
MSAYSAVIADKLTLTSFLNDLTYQNKQPMNGVYFYDTVS